MSATQDRTGYKWLPAQKWITVVVNDHLQEETFSKDQMPTLLISLKKLTTTVIIIKQLWKLIVSQPLAVPPCSTHVQILMMKKIEHRFLHINIIILCFLQKTIISI
jgi:protease II